MLLGPWIGSLICGDTNSLFGVTGEGFVVSQYIFLGAIIVLLFIVIPLLFVRKENKEERKND